MREEALRDPMMMEMIRQEMSNMGGMDDMDMGMDMGMAGMDMGGGMPMPQMGGGKFTYFLVWLGSVLQEWV